MLMETVILGLLLVGLAKKKESVFGQLTLTGSMALDWLKPGTKIQAQKIMFGVINSFLEYDMPDWAKERNEQVVVVQPVGPGNPLLITQNGVMKSLEAQCVIWESEGANCTVEQTDGAPRHVIAFDESVQIEFKRDLKAGKFAPYEVKIKQ